MTETNVSGSLPTAYPTLTPETPPTPPVVDNKLEKEIDKLKCDSADRKPFLR